MLRDIATLHTARLTLRPLLPSDAAALVAGAGNYDVSRWLAVVPFPYEIDDAHRFLASRDAEARRSWAICDAGGLQGVISAREDMGYWLARDAWGKGYAVEAGDAVIDAAFADPTRSRLGANHMIGNARSAAVLDKLGFREIGEGRLYFRAYGQEAPVRLMEMTRADWRRLRPRRRWFTRNATGKVTP